MVRLRRSLRSRSEADFSAKLGVAGASLLHEFRTLLRRLRHGRLIEILDLLPALSLHSGIGLLDCPWAGVRASARPSRLSGRPGRDDRHTRPRLARRQRQALGRGHVASRPSRPIRPNRPPASRRTKAPLRRDPPDAASPTMAASRGGTAGRAEQKGHACRHMRRFQAMELYGRARCSRACR